MPSASEEMAAPVPMAAPQPPSTLDGWRRWTANGAIVTAVALGLRHALHDTDSGPQLVVDAPGEPPRPLQPVELHFDPAGPAHTWVVVRPWLLEGGP